MNGQDAFEQRLSRWLGDGPSVAPVGSVDAALAHVRLHPGRTSAAGRWWRRAMSGMTVTHVPSHPGQRWLAGAAAVILMVLAVGGFGLISRSSPGAALVLSPTPATTTLQVPSPTAEPTVAPTAPATTPGAPTLSTTPPTPVPFKWCWAAPPRLCNGNHMPS